MTKATLTLLRRYAQTVSRMKPRQIIWRVRRNLLAQFWKRRASIGVSAISPQACHGPFPVFGHPLTLDANDGWLFRADELCRGEFAFLNQMLAFAENRPDWSASPDGDPLWTYNLHYFEYGYDLFWAYTATGQSEYLECLLALMADWIKENPFWTPIAWNPYPLSRRLVVWLTLVGHLGTIAPTEEIVASLWQQASFLAHNLEYDVDNNHLITNARALLWAGVFLRNHPMADHWRQKGLLLLEQEAKRQVLADGGHYERSTSYQMVVLQDFLEVALLLEKTDQIIPSWLENVVARMYVFLLGMLRPDGTLPLLNDSVTGYPLPVSDLLAVGAVFLREPKLKAALVSSPGAYFDWLMGVAGRSTLDALPKQELAVQSHNFAASGYQVMRSGPPNDAYLIFDSGKIGPKHAPAHAHADTLSFELHAYGYPLIVDPGVYEYKVGIWRDLFRSTAMHNTVVVDGMDQSDFWGSFRVASLGNGRLLEWYSERDVDYVEGTHDGFAQLRNGVQHYRAIRFEKPNCWVISDRLESSTPALHQYDLYFHLSDCSCAVLKDNKVRCDFPEGIGLLFTADHPVETYVSIEQGWISSGWKQKTLAPVVRYSLRSNEPQVTFTTTMITTQRSRES